MNNRDVVVLTDAKGASLDVAPKLAAHEKGLLHLAFSVVLYNEDDMVLLQQRAAGKYHFPLRWANACCSHPGPGEEIADSAARRVEEELGFTVALKPAGSFTYRARCPQSGLIEHEFDHVFYGDFDARESGPISPDPSEVAATRWVEPRAILEGRTGLEVTPWLVDAVRLAEEARGHSGASG